MHVTRDFDAAFNFAARYLPPKGRPIPGDIYEVEPSGPLSVDPDFRWWPGRFGRCLEARICTVVQRGVHASGGELTKRMRNYILTLGLDGRPQQALDDTGVIRLTQDLAERGVTQEYLNLIRPWTDPERISRSGAIRVGGTGTPADVLDRFPSLDTGPHRIRVHAQHLICAECGNTWSLDQAGQASRHQLGEREIDLVVSYNRRALQDTAMIVEHYLALHPDRWLWLYALTGR